MEINEIYSRIHKLKDIIKKTLLAVQKYKNYDLILAGELNSTLDFLNSLMLMLNNLDVSSGNIVENIKSIETQLINLIKNYGTESLEEMINLVVGNDIKNNSKYDLLKCYVHPINCRLILKSEISFDSEEYNYRIHFDKIIGE